jgi:hypothetical protein
MKAEQIKIWIGSNEGVSVASPSSFSAKVVLKTVKTIKTSKYSPALEKLDLFLSENSLMHLT